MKKVYEAENLFQAQLLKDQLEDRGIEIFIQGSYLQGALGELPVNTFPTLWVIEDEDESLAKDLLKQWEQSENTRAPWWCPACHEHVDAGFEQCWSCGYVKKNE